MKNLLPAAGLLALLAGAPACLAQWSSDPFTNTLTAQDTGDQVQPKVRQGPGGTVYISFFDAIARGYDVRIQKLSRTGQKLWGPNGLLIASRGVTSTTDYDMDVDSAGNAIVSFPDDRAGGGVQQITVSKVSPEGVLLWNTETTGGVTVSSGAAFKATPRTALLSDGSIAVAWTEGGGFRMARLSSDGVLDPSPATVLEAGRSLFLSDIQPGDNGSAIALWVRPTGSVGNPPRQLYTQKYNPTSAPTRWAPLWTNTPGLVAVVLYAPTVAAGGYSGSVPNGYFPSFESDGSGGAVYAWYENAGPRSSYVQRIDASGTAAFPLNGLNVTTTLTNNLKISAGLSYNAGTGDMFVTWTETNTNQNQWGLRAQKISSNGSLLWSDIGTEILPLNGNQSSFAQCVESGGGCTVVAFDARNINTNIVIASRVNADGSLAWGNVPVQVSSRTTAKGRLSVWPMLGTSVVAGWHDGTTADSDIYTQTITSLGTLGQPPCGLSDIAGAGQSISADGELTADDIIVFLNRFFAGDLASDVSGPGQNTTALDGELTADDIIVFLNRFFAGC